MMAREHLGVTVLLLALLVCASVQAASPNPTPQRSYVSLGGSDGASCGPGAPCRTWQAALAQTQPGGEILTLDSGGFGLLTITQGVTLVVPPGVYGGMSPPASSSGIVINAPGDTVVIRGVTVMSQGGVNGIDIVAASHVVLQDVTVANFNPTTGGASGILVEGAVDVRILHSTISGNGHGIYVAASGASVSVVDSAVADSASQDIYLANPQSATSSTLTLTNSDLTGAPVALLVEPSAGATTVASVDGSRFHGNGTAVVAAVPGSGSFATVDLANSHMAFNSIGVSAFGAGAKLSLQQCILSGNSTAGVTIISSQGSPGEVVSFGNNAFLNNGVDVTGGSLTAAPVLQ